MEGDEALPLPWDELGELELARHYPLDELCEAVGRGERVIHVIGAGNALRALLVAQLGRRTGRQIVVVAPGEAAARALAEDLALFVEDPLRRQVVHFPQEDTSPYGDVSPDRQIALGRLRATFNLSMGIGGRWVVLSAQALARKGVPADTLLGLADVITPTTTKLSNQRLRRLLAEGGYSAVSLVEDPGTYAIRGDVVDVWSPFDDRPVRIERWGDEVTSLRSFDPGSQRTREPVEECFLCPVREELLGEENLQIARQKLLEVADQCQVPSRRVQQVLDDLQAGLHFLGIEGLLPAFYPALEPLGAQLPADALLVVLEPEACHEEVERLWAQRHEEHLRRQQEHDLAFPPDALYERPEAVRAWLEARAQALHVRRLRIKGDGPEEHGGLEFRARSNTDLAKLRKERQGAEGAVRALGPLLEQWRHLYGRIIFACESAGEVERLTQLLESYGQPVERLTGTVDPLKVEPTPGQVWVARGALSAGLRAPALGLALIAGREVFGHRARSQGSTSGGAKGFQETTAIASFRELEPGDMVVHAEFGIGRYGGLHKMIVGGVPSDFLLIEYSGKDKLYLPVYRLGRVQKYLGQSAEAKLDKLGGTAWERIKERVKGELKELAVDLIRLYARRQSHPGVSFSGIDNYYREFEAAFTFEPTPDQEQAIEDTLRDMQRPTVMDRLICGDVGFGKTEVAMRAAFKAVLDGYQVAVLVPTTVLCEQHLASFRKRFAGYPVRVEAVSRFRTKQEVSKILHDVEAGQVDVLIGTHRLLSGDVKFRRLGLLIVDEEQRFGVTHKEQIKELRTQVDCLTLSATPIPRTLQMSLLGIRDMSVIATPPPGRLAVRTHIARSSDTVIREAILRELQRGGQVYFVHNRVQTIHEVAHRLRELVPEARVGVGHGQMKEGELEKIMLDFVQGRFNVLLSTTIIESGLDISNANTMLIDRADTFGLSQLYQLRGRIGRSRQRAFCYLLVNSAEKLTEVARERLDVIERFSELGSGFHVASYDLEIRGAGNILGPQQSGSVAAVGLEMYGELLEEAILEVKGEEVQREIEPEVNIPIPAYLPEGYIQDTSLRLLFYKRLSLARSDEELYDLYSEVVDRFGAAPPEVESLREVIAVKIALRRLRCPRLDVGAGSVHITLGERPILTPEQAVALIQSSRGRWTLTPAMKLIRNLKPQEAEDRLRAARMVCRELLDAADL
jgi:transcription-repair coupling factor (superfamily II helicase)